MSQEEYIIEKNIEMPSKRHTKWSWIEDMKVGDSFICPKKVRPVAHVIFKRIGWKMTSRSISQDQIRIWRKS